MEQQQHQGYAEPGYVDPTDILSHVTEFKETDMRPRYVRTIQAVLKQYESSGVFDVGELC